MAELLHPLKIGDVALPNNLVLSPMAGFSDLPFRALARRHGAGLVCTEMVSAQSVNHAGADTLLRMRTLAEEMPVSIQLFGTDPVAVAQAARAVDPRCAILGFNMGCPADQIRRQGCGAALLDHPDLCVSVVEAVKGASSKPLLAKMRAGNGSPMDAGAFARRLEAAGADGIILHGRTAKQYYSGLADWRLIAAVKAAVGIPVIGNGDVVDGPTAARALGTGVDGIAIGRASLGDPHVFARIAAYLSEGRLLPAQDAASRLADFREYAARAAACGIPHEQVVQQAQQFTRGLAGSARARSRWSGNTPLASILVDFEGLTTPAMIG